MQISKYVQIQIQSPDRPSKYQQRSWFRPTWEEALLVQRPRRAAARMGCDNNIILKAKLPFIWTLDNLFNFVKHFFSFKTSDPTPFHSTFKIVATLHSSILDFFRNILWNFLSASFITDIFNVDRCKNLPLSNRSPQTLGSYSMSSAPPLPATKKNDQNTSNSLRQLIKIFHTITPFIGRHFSTALRLCLVNPPLQKLLLDQSQLLSKSCH